MSGNPGPVATVRHTTCCVAGAGPAGVMLALLLARQNIPVVLLESHADFDRGFRGDSIHPSILEVLDQLGLAEGALALPHRKIRAASLPTDPPLSLSFDELRSRFPFMTLMAQQRFLGFLTDQAAHFPAFTLIMKAVVQELVVVDGRVRGLRYRSDDGLHEVDALLTVGADGRSSTVRRKANLPAVTYGSAIDVLWLRLPRRPTDPEGIITGAGRGRLILAVDRGERWQLGIIIPKGSYRSIRAAGLKPMRDAIAAAIPALADRVDDLTEWRQIAMLSVRSDRLKRWHRPRPAPHRRRRARYVTCRRERNQLCRGRRGRRRQHPDPPPQTPTGHLTPPRRGTAPPRLANPAHPIRRRPCPAPAA